MDTGCASPARSYSVVRAPVLGVLVPYVGAGVPGRVANLPFGAIVFQGARRLWDGKHPVFSRALGEPRPLTMQAWRALFGPVGGEQPADRCTVRTYSEFVAGDQPARVVIPANATVNGVPVRRLTAKRRTCIGQSLLKRRPVA